MIKKTVVSPHPTAEMCSSRIKPSFRMDDILNRKPKTDHVNRTNNATTPNVQDKQTSETDTGHYRDTPNHRSELYNRTKSVISTNKKIQPMKESTKASEDRLYDDVSNLPSRLPPLHHRDDRLAYPTMPIIPTPLKPEVAWSCDTYTNSSFQPTDPRSRFHYFSDSMQVPEHYLRNCLLNRNCSLAPIMGCPPYGFDRGSIPGYWASYLGYLPALVKRKGGQVRFTSQQTNTLERRFAANKYLSPEDRRLLARQLKLSDRQVKTWFQNRRAKWRRTSGDKTEPEDVSEDDASSESKADSV